MSTENLKLNAELAHDLSKRTAALILSDPRTETHLYDPAHDYESEASSETGVPSKKLTIPDLPGFGKISAGIYDVLDSHKGKGHTDIGIARRPRPEIEERELFTFNFDSVSFYSIVQSLTSDDYTELANMWSGTSEDEFRQIEARLEPLLDALLSSQ
jgi:hypothetical protein